MVLHLRRPRPRLQLLLRAEVRRLTTDNRCVTRWSRFDARFKGELATLVRPKPTARYVLACAEQDFTANVPLEALEDENALLALGGGRRAAVARPRLTLRLMVPTRYFWNSAKWLRGLELLSADRPRFWERYGYHNDADHWREERYGFWPHGLMGVIYPAGS